MHLWMKMENLLDNHIYYIITFHIYHPEAELWKRGNEYLYLYERNNFNGINFFRNIFRHQIPKRDK